jgi:hypothetical protein
MSATGTGHEDLRPTTPSTYYEGVVRLPGYGDAPNRCRDLSPVGFCEAGHTILGRSSCGTRYCPDHWRDWIKVAVVNLVARMAAYREAQEMGPQRRLSHVVASPPQDRRYSERSLFATRSDAYEALEAAGVRGGAAVTHPYRTNDRGDELYRAAGEAGDLDEDTGRWRFLRDVTEDWKDLTRYIEASPHYHTLAAGADIDGSKAPDGWIVERVRTFKGFHYRDVEAYRDMAQTAYYVLTHGAAAEGRTTTTYFGELAPASFSPEEELTATRWDTIQRMAEEAVTAPVEEGEGTGGVDRPEECPREACEAAVRPLADLREKLEDTAWRDGLKWEHRARLRGALVWYSGRSDRPPPSKATDRESLRRWLRELGEAYVPRPGGPERAQPTPVQSQLPDAWG